MSCTTNGNTSSHSTTPYHWGHVELITTRAKFTEHLIHISYILHKYITWIHIMYMYTYYYIYYIHIFTIYTHIVKLLFTWIYRQYIIGIIYTWWLIPLSKWVITPVINGISRVNPLITGVISHLLSGMSHQVYIYIWIYDTYESYTHLKAGGIDVRNLAPGRHASPKKSCPPIKNTP